MLHLNHGRIKCVTTVSYRPPAKRSFFLKKKYEITRNIKNTGQRILL